MSVSGKVGAFVHVRDDGAETRPGRKKKMTDWGQIVLWKYDQTQLGKRREVWGEGKGIEE